MTTESGIELPTAAEILPPGTARPLWLEARRGGIGGSDCPVVLGVNRKWSSPYRVWQEKTGRVGEQPASEAMIRGNWLEPHIRERFANERGLDVRPVGVAEHVDEPWLMCTLDGATVDAAVEIKSVDAPAVRQQWREGVDPVAWTQLQHQLMVTGLPSGWLVAYLIDEGLIVRGPIEPDLELHERMRETFAQWWAGHVVADVPPPVELDTVTVDEVRARFPRVVEGTRRRAEWPDLARELLAERRELAAVASAGNTADRRKREIDAALMAMIEDAAELVDADGTVLYTARDQRGNYTVDPALADDHPDIWRRYVRQPTHRRLTIAKDYR